MSLEFLCFALAWWAQSGDDKRIMPGPSEERPLSTGMQLHHIVKKALGNWLHKIHSWNGLKTECLFDSYFRKVNYSWGCLELPNSLFWATVITKTAFLKNYCGYFGFVPLVDIVTCPFMKSQKGYFSFPLFCCFSDQLWKRNIKQTKASSRFCTTRASLKFYHKKEDVKFKNILSAQRQPSYLCLPSQLSLPRREPLPVY